MQPKKERSSLNEAVLGRQCLTKVVTKKQHQSRVVTTRIHICVTFSFVQQLTTSYFWLTPSEATLTRSYLATSSIIQRNQQQNWPSATNTKNNHNDDQKDLADVVQVSRPAANLAVLKGRLMLRKGHHSPFSNKSLALKIRNKVSANVF